VSSPSSSFPISAVAQSGLIAIDALLAGVKWGGPADTGVALTYSFPLANGAAAVFADSPTAPYSPLEEPMSAMYALNAAQQAAAADALSKWSAVANVAFTPVPDTPAEVGDIRVAFTATPRQGDWGWTYYPSASPMGGDVWINQAGTGSAEQSWAPDGCNYQAMLHELGHALGLKHPSGGGVALPPAMDNMLYSVMSYTPPPKDIFFRTLPDANGHLTSVIWTVVPDTPMLLDIAAAQYLYGANMSYHAGDDVYTFDPHTPFYRTIWDAGGTNTISVANFADGCTIDLRAGHFSSITMHSDPLPPGSINYYQPTYDGSNNMAIAYGTVIQNAIGGAGNDTIVGNDADNVITGGAGNDAIDGGGGTNTACYSGPAGSYVVKHTAVGLTVADTRGIDGVDTLANIQRLAFADRAVALDIDGNAGVVARILGAVFGHGASADPTSAGIGLQLLGAGAGPEQVMGLALEEVLGGTATDQAVVDLLYANVVGAAPDPAVESRLVGLLQSHAFTRAQLGMMAADSAENAASIGLDHLADTGLAYLPVTSGLVLSLMGLVDGGAGASVTG
jgi:serralysin